MQNRAPAWCQYGPYCKCGMPIVAINGNTDDGINPNGNGGNSGSGGNNNNNGNNGGPGPNIP